MARLRTYLVGATGCMVTTGQLNNGGYSSHCAAWRREVGPIPEGFDLDHLCRNRWCVNVAHLEPVSRSENLKRGDMYLGRRPDPDWCGLGLHPWVPENIYIRPSDGKRRCLACNRRQKMVPSEGQEREVPDGLQQVSRA